MSRVRRVALAITPPILVPVMGRLSRLASGQSTAPEWEVFRGGEVRTPDGWNVQTVADAQAGKWRSFAAAISGTEPLGIAHEANPPYEQSFAAHDLAMSFGYVLARTALGAGRPSVLDWGGGLGHYYLLARALLPEVDLEYCCKEVPVLCAAGRALIPEVTFVEDDDAAFGRSYDLAMASGSLHYANSWPDLLCRLAGAARRHVYVTRLPTTATAPSYRLLQRAHRYGYSTEYVGWVLNRSEFLQAASDCGLQLVREFNVQERPVVAGAPEPCEYRGFLFRPTRSD